MQIKEVDSRRGKTYEVVGYLGRNKDGTKARAKKRGFETKRSAEQWFNNQKLLFENGEGRYNKKTTPDVMTIQELYDMWLETYQYTVEESTLGKTMKTIELHILPKWGKVLVSDIKPIDLQRYINTLQGQLLHYRKVVAHLKRLVRLAVRMDMIPVDPFTKVEMPKQRRNKNKPKQFMDVDEFKAFIDVLDNQYCNVNRQAYVLLRLAAFTGMRTEELLALQWKHVDFNGGYIHIVQALGRGLRGGTYLKEPKSASSKRTIKVDSSMMSVLADFYDSSSNKTEDDFVFNVHGDTLNIGRPNKWMHDVSEQYGVAVGLSMHKLRHTWATLALDQGASIKQVQTYLGHADVSMTLNVYSDITKRASDETGNVLSKLTLEEHKKGHKMP
ncbi:site-specific integrase [Fructobacillus fructosus]|uniref:site-specific integrase n=1 Tax=Fructobacillus fructosus TaxID=1631 RepID=UPI002D8ECCED|nr:Integrase/recombinase [Fructobacillus fructosus]